MKSISKERILGYDLNGSVKEYFYIYTPFGRGMNMGVDDMINLEGARALKGCSYKIIKHDGIMVNSIYQKAMSGLKNVRENIAEDFGTADRGFQELVKEALLRFPSEFLSEQGDDKSLGGLYQWIVVITAPNSEMVELQKELILNHWHGKTNAITKDNNPLKYFYLKPLAGQNKWQREHLLTRLDAVDRRTNTTTMSNYTPLSFFALSTLQDPKGLEFGFDRLAHEEDGPNGELAQPKVLIDTQSSFEKLILIAHPRESSRQDYVFSDRYTDPQKIAKKKQSQASVTAQMVANHALMEGHKVVHIVLNDFDYSKLETPYTGFASGGSKRDLVMANSQIIDGSTMRLNPFQPFTPVTTMERQEDVDAREANSKKIRAMVACMMKYAFTSDDDTNVSKAFDELLSTYNLWSPQASSMSGIRDYLGRDATVYPAFGEFLVALEARRLIVQNEEGSDEAKGLRKIINSVRGQLTSLITLIGSKTDFELDPTMSSYYIQLTNRSRTQKNLQVMNMLDYLKNTLSPLDVIVIHGADQLDKRSYEYYLKDEFKSLQDEQNRVRLVLSFDATDEATKGTVSELGTTNPFTLNGLLYPSYSTEVDMFFCGKLDSVDPLTNLIKSKVNSTVEGLITGPAEGRQIFSRPRTRDFIIMGGRPNI